EQELVMGATGRERRRRELHPAFRRDLFPTEQLAVEATRSREILDVQNEMAELFDLHLSSRTAGQWNNGRGPLVPRGPLGRLRYLHRSGQKGCSLAHRSSLFALVLDERRVPRCPSDDVTARPAVHRVAQLGQERVFIRSTA